MTSEKDKELNFFRAAFPNAARNYRRAVTKPVCQDGVWAILRDIRSGALPLAEVPNLIRFLITHERD